MRLLFPFLPSILTLQISFQKILQKFLKWTGNNNYAIDLIKKQQLSYKLIYSLGSVEIETLKTYIKTNLGNSFIRPFKSLVGALILFVKKPNRRFELCFDYKDLNNLTIKNLYLLSLIGESLDWLGYTKRFSQLNLISAYYWICI